MKIKELKAVMDDVLNEIEELREDNARLRCTEEECLNHKDFAMCQNCKTVLRKENLKHSPYGSYFCQECF